MTPDDYECRTCHVSMYVPGGMDPLDEDVRYCDSCAADEIERLRTENARLTRELDASRKALREFGVDFLRVYHDAKGLYQCARRGYRIETTIPYLEEPEAPK